MEIKPVGFDFYWVSETFAEAKLIPGMRKRRDTIKEERLLVFTFVLLSAVVGIINQTLASVHQLLFTPWRQEPALCVVRRSDNTPLSHRGTARPTTQSLPTPPCPETKPGPFSVTNNIHKRQTGCLSLSPSWGAVCVCQFNSFLWLWNMCHSAQEVAI